MAGKAGSGANGHHEWQLVFFTILTQMAVGAFFFWGMAAVLIPAPNPFTEGLYPQVILIVVLLVLALGTLSAGYHLGYPLHAVFSIANIRSSWLSREALLGACFGLIGLILLILRTPERMPTALDDVLILLGITFGLALIYTLSRLYMLRTVPAWNHNATPATFFATTFLLGVVAATTVWLALIFWDDGYAIESLLSKVIPISTTLMLLFSVLQASVFVIMVLKLRNRGGAATESIRLLRTDLGGILTWRFLLMFLGIGILVLKLVFWLSPLFYFLAFGLILISEILGRFLFYGFYQREGF